jgi:hypothetical protein
MSFIKLQGTFDVEFVPLNIYTNLPSCSIPDIAIATPVMRSEKSPLYHG